MNDLCKGSGKHCVFGSVPVARASCICWDGRVPWHLYWDRMDHGPVRLPNFRDRSPETIGDEEFTELENDSP